jgi:hypothetical protein
LVLTKSVRTQSGLLTSVCTASILPSERVVFHKKWTLRTAQIRRQVQELAHRRVRPDTLKKDSELAMLHVSDSRFNPICFPVDFPGRTLVLPVVRRSITRGKRDYFFSCGLCPSSGRAVLYFTSFSATLD